VLPFIRADQPHPSLSSNHHRCRILPFCGVVYVHRRPPEVSHHRAAPFSPPSSTHRHSELVSILLARRLTRDSVKLAPTTSEHLGRQATPGHRATLPVAGVVTVSWRLGRVGYFGSRIGPARPGPHGLSACWPTRATSPWEQRPRANFSLSTVPSFFYYPNLFSNLNIHRNSVILLKYIENGLNLRKI
jgi:hypothetical protein